MSTNNPNDNPYQSMPQAKPVPVAAQVATGRPNPRSARLGFFDSFFEAKDLLGDDYWLFWGLIFVGGMVAGAVPFVLLGPIYCGFGLCFLAKERRQRPSFELMFKGFEQFMETLIPVLLYSLFILLVIPFYLGGVFGGMLMLGSGDGIIMAIGVCMMLAGFSIMIVGSTFIGYVMFFACFLVAEYKLEGMDAFKVSWAGIQKNMVGLFAVVIASSILAFAGMLLCYIPLLLMMPMLTGAPFICYRKIFRGPPGATQESMQMPTMKSPFPS